MTSTCWPATHGRFPAATYPPASATVVATIRCTCPRPAAVVAENTQDVGVFHRPDTNPPTTPATGVPSIPPIDSTRSTPDNRSTSTPVHASNPVSRVTATLTLAVDGWAVGTTVDTWARVVVTENVADATHGDHNAVPFTRSAARTYTL